MIELADRIRQHTAGAGADLETLDALADRAEEGPPISRLRAHLEAIEDALTDALAAAANPTPQERKLEQLTRLQSAHHRMLRVTAVTCDACKKERAR